MDDKEREVKRTHKEEEAGQKGGSLEAQMAAGTYPVARQLAVPLGWVNWNAIAAGAAIALATTILLNSLGAAIGLALTRLGYGGSLAYWMIGATAVGLFLGSYLAARTAQVRTVWTGILHAITIWSVFMLLDVIGIDLFGGLSRFFFASGVATAPTGTIRDITMASGWWFFIGYLIALVASVLGGASGVTVEETEENPHLREHEERRRH